MTHISSSSNEIIMGLWKFDVIEGGLLKAALPNSKSQGETTKILSSKIKNLLLLTLDSNKFNQDWSFSPITIENNHFYLYGFFTLTWNIISIQLPVDFSVWLIETKNDLLSFESLIQEQNFEYLPENQWIDQLKPIFDDYQKCYENWSESISET